MDLHAVRVSVGPLPDDSTPAAEVIQQLAEAVERRRLPGAPAVRVVASAERHATIDRTLRFLNLGADGVTPVATDAHGAIELGDLNRALAEAAGAPTIVCLQAGNVNSGAFDDLSAATAIAAVRTIAW